MKLAIFSSGMLLSTYIAKNPKIILKGMDFVNDMLNKPVDSLDSFKVYSKSLGRYLTEEELISKGLL